MRAAVWVCAAVVGCFVAGFGQISAATIDVDTVLGPDHPYPDQTIVVMDGATPPTVLTIAVGAVIGGEIGQSAVPTGVDAYDSSIIIMQGGIVTGSEQAIRLNDHAELRYLGGEIDLSEIEARDSSRVQIHDGFWKNLTAYDSARIAISGAVDGIAAMFGRSRIVVDGGNPSDIWLADESVFIMQGGILGESLIAEGSSRALINAGGGGATGLIARDFAVVSYRGGILPEDVEVTDNAVLHLFGTGLRFDEDDDGLKWIVGQLADGAGVRSNYQLEQNGQIILHEVPEPGTFALLGLGALTLLPHRLRRAGESA